MEATIAFSAYSLTPSANVTIGAVSVAEGCAPGNINDAIRALRADGKDLANTVAGITTGAPLNSPAFTGIPTAPTATAGTNTTQIATTAFVQASGAAGAPLASPAFTGIPTAPTATAGTNTTQIATTAFVQASGAAGAPLASPAFTGVPTAPTAVAGASTVQIATTAFVAAVTRPSFPGNPSASFTAADADNNTHKVASGASQTLTLGSITAGTAFTIRFTTAWSIACAGGLSKGGAAPGAVTTGAVAANSVITFLHEGAGVWIASGTGLS